MPLLVSPVSFQELLSWVATQGTDAVRDFEKFMREHFNVLDFLEDCARHAAYFQAGNPIQKIKPKSEMKQVVDVWFRDAALAGTAIHYHLPLIVTGDRRFAENIRAYAGFTGRVELLEETVMITVPSPASPQPGDGAQPVVADDSAPPNGSPQTRDVVPPAEAARQDVALSPTSN